MSGAGDDRGMRMEEDEGSCYTVSSEESDESTSQMALRLLSTLTKEGVEIVDIASSEDEDDVFLPMSEALDDRAPPNPGLRHLTVAQRLERNLKYGPGELALRRRVETVRINKVNRIVKLPVRPGKTRISPLWTHRAGVFMGKASSISGVELRDMYKVIPRELFIQRTADRVVTQIVGPKVKLNQREWENRMLEKHYREEEEREDELINKVVQMETANNFGLFTLWACRYGDEEAHHRLGMYTARLKQEKERIVGVRRRREALGLRTRDVVDRLRATRDYNTVVDGVRNLNIEVPSSLPPASTRGRLLRMVKEKMEERASRPIVLRGSKLDVEAAIR